MVCHLHRTKLNLQDNITQSVFLGVQYLTGKNIFYIISNLIYFVHHLTSFAFFIWKICHVVFYVDVCNHQQTFLAQYYFLPSIFFISLSSYNLLFMLCKLRCEHTSQISNPKSTHYKIIQ